MMDVDRLDALIMVAIAQQRDLTPALRADLASAAHLQYALRWPLAGCVVCGSTGGHRLVLVGRQ